LFLCGLNSGYFWRGLCKKPGKIVLRFRAPLSPGLEKKTIYGATQESSLFFPFQKIETVGHNPLMVMGCLAALLGTAHLTAAAAIPPAGAATAIRETNLRLDLKKRN